MLPIKVPNKILVIAMPYLGDVLLATPLFHSLKRAFPNAQLDVLVFRNCAVMLEGNPDINRVITTPNRPTHTEKWLLFKQIFRRYDLAMAIQTGDRPFFYTLFASPIRVNVVPPKKSTGWWKRFFAYRWTEFDNDNTHTVLQNLKLLDLLNIPPYFLVIPPRPNNIQQLQDRFAFLLDTAPYVVIHPLPQWNYKRWTLDAWQKTGEYLNKLGFKLVLSGGPIQEEIDYVANLASKLPDGAVNLAGQVTIAELTHIIAQATLFIGPDTGITHLAAATGIPVIALFGPTNPVKWSPWPNGYQHNKNPFERVGTQQVNNVFLVQGEGDCVPCHQEGCDRNRLSRSKCLDDLLPEKIKGIALSILQNEAQA
jgi:heptosyltransferase-3